MSELDSMTDNELKKMLDEERFIARRDAVEACIELLASNIFGRVPLPVYDRTLAAMRATLEPKTEGDGDAAADRT